MEVGRAQSGQNNEQAPPSPLTLNPQPSESASLNPQPSESASLNPQPPPTRLRPQPPGGAEGWAPGACGGSSLNYDLEDIGQILGSKFQKRTDER